MTVRGNVPVNVRRRLRHVTPPALRAASRQAEEGEACHNSEGKGRDPGQPPFILGQQLQTVRAKLAPFHRDMICTTRSSQEDSVLVGQTKKYSGHPG